MVYRDLPGNPGFLPHRINDISLKVTSPLGTVYFGNNGLTAGNVSTPGGSANSVDARTSGSPTRCAGAWTVQVAVADMNTDLCPAITGDDAPSFSLWITGRRRGLRVKKKDRPSCCTPGTGDLRLPAR